MRLISQYQATHNQYPALLLDAPRNMVYEEKFQFEIMQHKLAQTIESGEPKPEIIVEYIKWGYSFNQHRPIGSIYHNMINALILLGKVDGAYIVWKDAISLYPFDEEFQAYKSTFFSDRKIVNYFL